MTRNSYEMVPTDSLAPAEYNPNVLSPEQYIALVNEVREQGRLLKPIIAREANGRPVIVDGHWSWLAARDVGLAMVPVEVIEADEFEARRQTLIRNRTGRKDNLKLGRVYRDMLAERSLSNRELAEILQVSEGSIRNQLLYPECWELLREQGERGMTESGAPIEPECYLWHAGLYVEATIAGMTVRALRALMGRLQGLVDEETDSDQPAADQPADEERHLRLVKLHWPKITGDGQQKFYEWSGIAQKLAELFDQQQVLVREAHAKGYAEGFEQGRAQRVTVTQSEPGRPRKQQASEPEQPITSPRNDSVASWLQATYADKQTCARRVLDFMRDQPDEVARVDIVNAVECPPAEAQRALDKLKVAGFVRKVGYGRYIITDAGRAAASSEPAEHPADETRNNWKELGAAIRAARMTRHMSGKALAELTGDKPSIVSMVELGQVTKSGGPKAGAPAFARLAAALGLGT
jgi:ParB-like chromosome segregation protein Spo0J